MHLHDKDIKLLEEIALQIRKSIIEMLVEAGSGHTAGPMGMADVFTALYFHILKHKPKDPTWPDRDRFILSNGHICPVLYATMAHAGYFPKSELKTLRQYGTRLQGHPHREKLPGLETSSGPLGEGLGQASGMAYAFRMNGTKQRVYVMMGDGELDEGSVWEAAMFAGKNKLNNLVGIIDRNNIQIDGMTEQVMPLESLRKKWEAFNWYVIEVDAHNFEEIIDATEKAKAIYEQPVMIIAHSIPGKGIEEIEFDYTWHGKPPTPEEGQRFLNELRTLGGKIQSEHQ